MISQARLLVQLIHLVDLIPAPPPPTSRKPGRPYFYPHKLFLKALIIMVIKRLHKPYELYSMLTQESADAEELRALLFEQERFPSLSTFQRRLALLPEHLCAQIACLGAHLVHLLVPWAKTGRAAAIDSTVLRARGAPWHKKDREAGRIPNTSIDTEAHWTKSGWHGWVYGWKLHLVTVVAGIWIPLAARLRPANEADNTLALQLLRELPAEVRFVLADVQYNTEEVHDACADRGCLLVASGRGSYPRSDHGACVRKVFHALRSATIERFNSLFKNIFDARLPVPTRGLVSTQRFALGAVFVYQLFLLYRFQQGISHQIGMKALIRSA